MFTLISALLNLAMWYNVTGEGVTVAFAALYGFFSGSYFSIIPVRLPRCLSHVKECQPSMVPSHFSVQACITMISPIDKIGARIGTLFMFMSFGALAGTPIGGVFIRERTKDHFQHLIAFSVSQHWSKFLLHTPLNLCEWVNRDQLAFWPQFSFLLRALRIASNFLRSYKHDVTLP